MEKYDDIINLPRPELVRPRMNYTERAAQFAPFSALTGYDEAVGETARIVDRKIELSEDEKDELDRKTKEIRKIPEEKIAVTYFVADKNKTGGAYFTACGFVRKIDKNGRFLLLSNGEKIPVDDILDIELSDEQQTDGSYD